jgi:hypothetical protein
VNYVSGENWGVSLVGLDGLLDVLESEPAALFVDVLRE